MLIQKFHVFLCIYVKTVLCYHLYFPNDWILDYLCITEGTQVQFVFYAKFTFKILIHLCIFLLSWWITNTTSVLSGLCILCSWDYSQRWDWGQFWRAWGTCLASRLSKYSLSVLSTHLSTHKFAATMASILPCVWFRGLYLQFHTSSKTS